MLSLALNDSLVLHGFLNKVLSSQERRTRLHVLWLILGPPEEHYSSRIHLDCCPCSYTTAFPVLCPHSTYASNPCPHSHLQTFCVPALSYTRACPVLCPHSTYASNLCPHSHLQDFCVPALSFLPLRLVHTALFAWNPPSTPMFLTLLCLICQDLYRSGFTLNYLMDVFPDPVSASADLTAPPRPLLLQSPPAQHRTPRFPPGSSRTLLSLVVDTSFSPLDNKHIQALPQSLAQHLHFILIGTFQILRK